MSLGPPGKITYVSYFFDINRDISGTSLPSLDKYIDWMEQLFNLGLNMYFLTTFELHYKLRYKPRSNLYFKFLEDVPGMNKLAEVRKRWEGYDTNNPKKDTAEFAILMHAKFPALLMAIEENIFNNDYYAWIDAGLLKIATHPQLLLTITPSDKIKLMLMNYIGKDEVSDPDFFRSTRYKIAGGFFTGNAENMKLLAEDLVQQKFTGLEQEYLALAYRKFYHLFDPYYGDYSELICNYEKEKNNLWLAHRLLNVAIHHGDKEEEERVKKFLLRGS